MKLVLSNEFSEISTEEMEMLNGGGWKAAISAFVGGVSVAFTPVGCIVGGAGVGGGMFAFGCAALDYACNNLNRWYKKGEIKNEFMWIK